MQWRVSTDAVTRAYGFDYDEINRIKAEKYAEKATTFNANKNRYSVNNINYDLNGNIENLWRQGENSGTANFTYGYIDKLDYSYIGNTLLAVSDSIADIGYADFRDGTGNDTLEYAYDVNGNMIRDDNKGIINIKYNYLNLPKEIDFGGGKKIVISALINHHNNSQCYRIFAVIAGITIQVNERWLRICFKFSLLFNMYISLWKRNLDTVINKFLIY